MALIEREPVKGYYCKIEGKPDITRYRAGISTWAGGKSIVFISREQYELMAGIKRGTREMDSLFAELICWIKSSFGISVVYFVHEEQSQPQRCLLLRMFLETMKEIQDIALDTQNRHLNFCHQEEIRAQFIKLVRTYKRENEFFLKNIRIIAWNFDDLAKEDAYGKANLEIKDHIRSNYADAPIHNIYTIFSLAVFYHTDEQLAECQRNGTSGRIKADYYYFLKKYDEFNLFTPENFHCIFDSHENVEKNYQGNYYYYFK